MTVYAQYEKDAAATYTVTTDADATVAYGSNSAQALWLTFLTAPR